MRSFEERIAAWNVRLGHFLTQLDGRFGNNVPSLPPYLNTAKSVMAATPAFIRPQFMAELRPHMEQIRNGDLGALRDPLPGTLFHLLGAPDIMRIIDTENDTESAEAIRLHLTTLYDAAVRIDAPVTRMNAPVMPKSANKRQRITPPHNTEHTDTSRPCAAPCTAPPTFESTLQSTIGSMFGSNTGDTSTAAHMMQVMQGIQGFGGISPDTMAQFAGEGDLSEQLSALMKNITPEQWSCMRTLFPAEHSSMIDDMCDEVKRRETLAEMSTYLEAENIRTVADLQAVVLKQLPEGFHKS